MKRELVTVRKNQLPSFLAPAKTERVDIVSQDTSQLAKRQEIVKLYQAKPLKVGKCEWIAHIARRYMVSPATIRRELDKAEKNRLPEPKKQKALTSWSDEAIDYMIGFYLRAIKEVGDCSRKHAYLKTIRQGQNRGWKVGCQSSAYEILSRIDPLLISYARGGDRELDNYFYIARDLKVLSPMQVVVGDQHIFDWWVEDKETKEIFRPECYLWLDMRTRVVYGIAFSKNGKAYNSETVSQSLRMGLKRFGKFKQTYNDNGKPEISDFVTKVVNEIASYGMRIEDNSELYRGEDGYYAVENPEGEVVGKVKTSQEWREKRTRIFARVKNAKTKPIERFFSTLEQLLQDLDLPGKVKPLASSAPVEEENQTRLDRQKANGLLLSPEEFQLKVFEALELYENRKHSTLGCSPREELMKLYHQGWEPTFIDPLEVDFIFFRRSKRKIKHGRVLIDGVLLEGEPLSVIRGQCDPSVGITMFEGKSVEVRWNSDDPTEAFVVAPDRSIRPLRVVNRIDPTDSDEVSKLLEWKASQKKAVREKFKAFTSIIEGKVITTSTAQVLAQAEDKRQALPKSLTQEEMEAQAQAELARQEAYSSRRILPKAHKSPLDRYKWALDHQLSGATLTQSDLDFIQKYETQMSDRELAYWNSYKAINRSI